MIFGTETHMSIENKSFVLAGRFSGFSQADLTQRVQRLGGRVTASISSKTDCVVVGSNPGTRRQDAADRGIEVIDLDELLRRMQQAELSDGGQPLAEAADPRRFPRLEKPQRDGTYRECYGGGYRVRVQGELDAGKRVGTWRWYHPSGQLEAQIDYVDGVKQGAEQHWYDNGRLESEGHNLDDHRVGPWAFYYKNGKLEQRCNYDDDGQLHGEQAVFKGNGELIYRGGYLHGAKHGPWQGCWVEWKPYATEEGSFEYDQRRGVFEGWYKNGQLAYRTHYGAVDGEVEDVEFYEDGSPKLRARRVDGWLVERRRWDADGNETVESFDHGDLVERRRRDADGNETVEAFVDGLPKAWVDDTARMKRIAKKVSKKSGDYGMRQVLEKEFGRGDAKRVFVHMMRTGLLDVTADPNLLALVEWAHQNVETDDLLELIRRLPFDHHTPTFLADWPRELDLLTLRLYERDPTAFRDAFDELPTQGKWGVAAAMARLGEDVHGLIDDPTEALASYHARQPILDVAWPTSDGPKRRDAHDANGHTASFEEFLERFADRKRWPKALLEALLESERSSIHSNGRYRPALEAASPEQLVQLAPILNDGLMTVLLEWRDDDAQTLTDIAMALDDRKARAHAVASAIIKWGDAGKPIADELVEAFDLVYGPYPRAIAALPKIQRRRLIEADMATSYPKVGAYLHLVDDAQLWRRYFEQAVQKDYLPHKPEDLARLPTEALPIVAEAAEQADGEVQDTLRATIVRLLERAADRGETWEDRWDDYIRFDTTLRRNRFEAEPFQKVLSALPADRAVGVLRRELGRESTFARAFSCLPCVLDQELAEDAFGRLVERESTLAQEDYAPIQAGLQGFPNVGPWIKWLLREGAGNFLEPTFGKVLGAKAVEQLQREVKASGAEVAEALDEIGRLVHMAEAEGPGDHTIYVLRTHYAKPEQAGLNQIGGMPPGIGVERWPAFDDQPMVHLFTLDVDTMPAMRSALGDDVRTVSVFCHEPEANEATSPGNAWTAVITSTDEEIRRQPIARPKGVATGRPRYFEPVAVEVSPRVWQDDPEDRLRNAIFQAHARVLGEPIAIQEDIPMDNLLVQFDARFVDINLGDSGVMYVFEDTAFWQCY